jgi:hypothetical protein
MGHFTSRRWGPEAFFVWPKGSRASMVRVQSSAEPLPEYVKFEMFERAKARVWPKF